MAERVVISESSTEYLRFVRHNPPGRKTPIVDVVSKSSGVLLGQIRWFGQWRQFCFYPECYVVFNSVCLEDVQDKITELREERG